MSDPFLGELKLISWNYPPKGWAFANGQLLPINQNQALFSLMGTTYGGDGRVTFALPDLRGRVATHTGAGLTLGQRAGEAAHTLTIAELPQHVHQLQASASNGNQPTLGVLASANNLYADASNLTSMRPGSVSNVGGSQPHNNLQPYLVLNWIVALVGIFPSQS